MPSPYSAIRVVRVSGSRSVTSWPSASPDRTTAPSAANAAATVLFPLPVRPTIPTMKRPSAGRGRRGSVDIEPARPVADRDLERHPEPEAALHLDADARRDRLRFVGRALEQQLVVHLQQQ